MSKSTYLVFILFSLSAFASFEELKTERGRILVVRKENWQLSKEMFGIPFLYFSPPQNGQRSNISFTATGVEIDNELTGLSRDPQGFRTLKEAWAKTVQAKITGVSPSKKWKNDQGHEVSEFGVEYLHEGKSYVEKSYYINCRGGLIYSKALRLKGNASHAPELESFITQLDCNV